MRNTGISLVGQIFYAALIGILAVAVGNLAHPAFAETNNAQINSTICKEVNVPLLRLNSKSAVEGFVEGEILANYMKNGFVDWQCLVDDFDSAAENTSDLILKKVSNLGGSDVYRFTIDKTGGIFGAFRGLFFVSADQTENIRQS